MKQIGATTPFFTALLTFLLLGQLEKIGVYLALVPVGNEYNDNVNYVNNNKLSEASFCCYLLLLALSLLLLNQLLV